MKKNTNLQAFDNSWYHPGRGVFARSLWFVFEVILESWLPGSMWRRMLLNAFGAEIGKRVVIKPRVRIKYPWRLTIGENSWIGEGVWIDNLGDVNIGANCCLSQGAMLLCGNHNYKKSGFDLMVGDITLEEGVWIGARALVCPGIHCGSHSILYAQSTATKNLEARKIYSGNPAQFVREREMES
ncbi:MAG: WcaF family extracellular polysaccharide biosynthesis acetyltransferase [Bacteroidetes bacterium]|nr:WcaF family extracellular polysaccharide biosynthesis acetyltransferase [Bacteroidota bacterium]